MFTFGRDHEKKCAIAKCRNPDQAAILAGVVDAVHDLLDGKSSLETIRPVLIDAIAKGGSGVWESTGNWMLKIANDHPEFATIWRDLALDPDWQARFRVACFLNDIPQPLATEIGANLKTDRSQKVREMAIARLETADP
jgi:hypothetical protein